jgi:hypothetical protein
MNVTHNLLPNAALIDALLPAYAPCAHLRQFGGLCRESHWQPESGHLPRGYVGATGALADVEVVMVFAEPGRPYDGERFEVSTDPKETVHSLAVHAHHHVSGGTELFHRNIRRFLDRLYPTLTFDQQLRHAWLTEGRLCSIDDEIGDARDDTCARHYLSRQLQLLPNAVVVAFGGKAQRYLRRLGMPHVPAFAMAPPGCNQRAAAPSWEAAARVVEARRAAR